MVYFSLNKIYMWCFHLKCINIFCYMLGFTNYKGLQAGKFRLDDLKSIGVYVTKVQPKNKLADRPTV